MVVRPRTSKSGVQFYSIEIEDANGKRMFMNVWQDDFTRFREEFVEGHLAKIRVRPPGGGFNTLTFESVPKHKRKYLPAKEDDYRLLLMKLPERVEPPKPEAFLDDLIFDESAVEGLENL
jgi:DNA polymerase III alpha subunit